VERFGLRQSERGREVVKEFKAGPQGQEAVVTRFWRVVRAEWPVAAQVAVTVTGDRKEDQRREGWWVDQATAEDDVEK
jgi:hypothetical protein